MDNKPRIGFIITKAETGGAQRWTLDQIQLLEPDVYPYLITGEDKWLTQALRHHSPLILPALLHKFPRLPALLALRRYVKKNHISTLVASSANAGVYARLMKLFFPNLRVVYISHGWSSIYNGGRLARVYTAAERLLAHLTDLIINVSQADAEKCSRQLEIPANKTVTLTNKTPKPIKPPAFLPQKPLKLLFLGRLAHPKRPDLLIEAISTFSPKELQLTVVGTGPAEAQLRKNAPENVVFAGEIQCFRQFNEYHALCLISDSEGLPMSALEAKAHSLPLLLSNVGGCHELIEEGRNGLLCENNISSIRDCLNQLIKNLENLQDGARETAPHAWLENAKKDYLSAYLGNTHTND